MRGVKRNEIVKFRISRLYKKVLERKARLAGLSLSEFCRRAAFRIEIKARLTEEEIVCYTTLINYANNFTRIANFMKNRNMEMLAGECLETSKLIKEHLEKFK